MNVIIRHDKRITGNQQLDPSGIIIKVMMTSIIKTNLVSGDCVCTSISTKTADTGNSILVVICYYIVGYYYITTFEADPTATAIRLIGGRDTTIRSRGDSVTYSVTAQGPVITRDNHGVATVVSDS